MANSNLDDIKKRREGFVVSLISEMDKGIIPWEKPWSTDTSIGHPENAVTGNSYRGMNWLMLDFTASKHGYSDPRWCTFKQAKDNGWSVKKGSKAAYIEYWKWDAKTPVLDENGKQKLDENGEKVFETVKLKRPMCVSHAVFNAEQIEGIPPYERQNKWNSVETAEKILTNSGAHISHQGSERAYYSPMMDMIVLPRREQFKSTEGYYGAALHELSHWTGGPSRLNRDLSGGFGSAEYAKEELRAELSSAFLNSELGIRKEFSDSAAYLQSWIQALKNDKDELYRAAYDAEKITNYILEFAKEKELSQEKATGKVPEVNLDAVKAAPKENATHEVEGGKTMDAKAKKFLDDHFMIVTSAGVSPLFKSENQLKPNMQEIADGKPAPCDIRLNVSYEQITPVKEQGAKWDDKAKCWYVPKGEDLSKFSAHLPQNGKMHALKDTPITVDYNERAAAKELGAWWNSEKREWYIPKGEDITKFDKKYFEPAPQKVKVVTKTFEEFAAERGLILDGEAVGDGKMHRAAVEGGKSGAKDGMYILYDDDKGRAGYVQNFKTGEKGTFAEKGIEFTLSEADRTEIAKAIEERKAETLLKQEAGAKKATYLVKHKFTQAEASHPYLQAKGVEPHGAKQDAEGKLIIPLQNVKGEIASEGDLIEVMDRLDRKVYALSGLLRDKFYLRCTPSYIKQVGAELVITEYYIDSLGGSDE